jgi:hypothetical protein
LKVIGADLDMTGKILDVTTATVLIGRVQIALCAPLGSW